MQTSFSGAPNKTYRKNRFFDGLRSSMLIKVPKDLSCDELNVVLGLGSPAVAAAASGTVAVTAPRDLIIRDLVIAAPAGCVVTAITVSGDAVLLGSPVPVETFATGNQARPSFDLPVQGGTQIQINYTNGATAGNFGSSFNID